MNNGRPPRLDYESPEPPPPRPDRPEPGYLGYRGHPPDDSDDGENTGFDGTVVIVWLVSFIVLGLLAVWLYGRLVFGR